jgi:ribonuclease Z
MQLTFLGTSAMVPTKERNVSGAFLSYKNEGILIDCGEGTQRQMNITGIKRTAVTKILISHWHGDHVAGLMGLLQTVSNEEEPPTIEVYGPKETKKRLKLLQDVCVHHEHVKLIVKEVDPPKNKVITVCETDEFKIEAAALSHGIPCLGYSFVEKERRKINMKYLEKLGVPEGKHLQDLQKGKDITYKSKKVLAEKATSLVKKKKITFIPDTEQCQACVNLAEHADVLVCECTYTESLASKARKHKHLTAKDAAMIANTAEVGKLVLTHFSQRYKNTQEIEENATNYFDNVVCAEDFMKITL